MHYEVQHFFDSATSTLTYVVWFSSSKNCVIIDPVWDFDQAASKLTSKSYETLVRFIRERNLRPRFILETHAHADHVSCSQLLKKEFPEVQLAIGEGITKVQQAFAPIYGWDASQKIDASCFDRLWKPNEAVKVDDLAFEVLPTPGHTAACVSYLFGSMVFTGDALFMPDSGTGRCDFPTGSARTLYHSISKVLYALPGDTQAFTGHDYQPQGRPLQFQSTIQEHKSQNIHLNAETSEEGFVAFREGRDRTLSAPKLLWPSVQINLSGGYPLRDSKGTAFLKLPLFIE